MTTDVSPSVVLVVEDELMLRMRAVDIVQDAGFESVEAINADEAIAILEAATTSPACSPTSRCRARWMGSSSPT